MKYLYASFKSYIGFYNGLGLEKLEIDFSKCIHGIILIVGINGCGKSTLMKSLNVFPDPASSFIPTSNASKKLVLEDNGTIYEIEINSDIDGKGGRKTTKAFIKKNGVELNTNGNVSSYKEIIFSEFSMDSNYASLSQLSSEDRGLGQKIPSDRKRFVSNILENLEVYNQMFKTLNKKSSIYKSHLNTLHTKIQNIGALNALETNRNRLQSEANELNDNIIRLNNEIVAIEAKYSIDEEEMKLREELSKKLAFLQNQLDSMKNTLNIFKNQTKLSVEQVKSKFSDNNSLLESYRIELDKLNNDWKNDSDRLSSITNNIRELEAQINTFNSDEANRISSEYTSISNKYKELSNQITALGDNVSEIELERLLSIYSTFIKQLDSFYDGLTPELLQYIVYEFNNNSFEKSNSSMENVISRIESRKDDIDTLTNAMKIISILDNRPKNCGNDKCPFIKDAIVMKSKYKDIDLIEELSKLQSERNSLSDSLTEMSNELNKWNNCIPKRTSYESLRNTIFENRELLEKYNDNICDNFDNLLVNMNPFNYQRQPQDIIDRLNLVKEYKSVESVYISLKAKYDSIQDNIKIINSSRIIIDKMKKEEESLISSTAKLRSQINNTESLISTLKSNIENEKKYIDVITQYESIEVDYNEAASKMKEFTDKSDKAAQYYQTIVNNKSEIARLNSTLIPINNDINSISGQITLVTSFTNEYNMYKESYTLLETLKKYCSPTAGGIQTLFMQLYMNKTLDLANQILSMLFNGEYRLLDFVINEKEFRIPFIGSGLAVDDISSGSTSQICMMSTIINLVLMYQASSKFNIAKLDEIDGGLDHRNRAGFVNVLYNAMPMLNIEQMFVISHSMEADTGSVDVIKLKSYDNDDSLIGGNVIYDYSKAIQETFN